MKERTSSIPDPSLHGFQHGSGLNADNTLSATRFSQLQSKDLWLKKETFLLYIVINPKKQSTKLEQLKHLKASQERAKTRRGSEATEGFQASKGTKTPKARP